MFSIRFPQVQSLPKTNLSQGFHHSILISILRGLAAIEVVAAHLRAQLYPSLKTLPDPTIWYQALAFFTGFAHQAVVIFFLLSGWLVGGSLLNKLHEPKAVASYAIDRITRLWIVLIPAFSFTLLFAIVSESVDPNQVSYARENQYSATSFIGNLFGLQGMAVPRFGGNFALWSLANETWYYVLFPLVLLAGLAKSMLARGAAAATVVLILYCLNFAIVLYFSIWLLGVAFSRIKIDASLGLRFLIMAFLACISIFFRLTGSNDILVEDSFVQDLVFSVAFLLLLCSLQFPANPASRLTSLADKAGRYFAGFSFTLYVIHVPLLHMLRDTYLPLTGGARLSPHESGDFVVYVLMLVSIVFIAYLFHLPFEAQTYRLRRMIRRMVFKSGMKRAEVANPTGLTP